MKLLIDWLQAVASRGSTELLVWSWQALVLLASVSLLTRIYRSKSSALRHQIWLFGLIAVMTLPSLSLLARRLPSLHPASPKLAYVAEAPRMVLDAAPQPSFSISTTQEAGQPAPGPTPARPVRLSSVLQWLFVMWIIGVIAVLVKLAKSHLTLRRALKRSLPVGLEALGCNESEELCAAANLRLSSEVRSPVLCGLFRPTILLPSDITAWTTASERRAMIHHELAHVNRRDTLTNSLQIVLQTVFFFHPLVRYACRQLSLEREMACDDKVVEMGASAEVYAEGILKVAERSLVSDGVYQLALYSARQHLERRIDMILSEDRVRRIAGHWRHLIIPAVLIAVAAWLVAPGRMAKSALAQQNPADNLEELIAKYMSDSKNFDDLVETALNSFDHDARRNAVLRLAVLEGDGSTAALVDLYKRSADAEIKRMVIDTLGRRNDGEQLAKLAEFEQSPEFQDALSTEIKRLEEQRVTGEPNVLLVWDSKNSTDESAPVTTGGIFSWRANTVTLRGNPVTMKAFHSDSDAISSAITTTTAKLIDSAISEQEVTALLREAAEANIRRDASFFERVLDDSYVGIGPDGETRSKADEIADVKLFPYDITKFDIDDLRVSAKDDMAFATFLGTVHFRSNRRESSAQFRYTVNLVKSAGTPKVVAIHVSRKN
jgi:beta-lactamase regulating signal transducer with metallopeptidase domain